VTQLAIQPGEECAMKESVVMCSGEKDAGKRSVKDRSVHHRWNHWKSTPKYALNNSSA